MEMKLDGEFANVRSKVRLKARLLQQILCKLAMSGISVENVKCNQYFSQDLRKFCCGNFNTFEVENAYNILL
jgi:hypothetical protein